MQHTLQAKLWVDWAGSGTPVLQGERFNPPRNTPGAFQCPAWPRCSQTAWPKHHHQLLGISSNFSQRHKPQQWFTHTHCKAFHFISYPAQEELIQGLLFHSWNQCSVAKATSTGEQVWIHVTSWATPSGVPKEPYMCKRAIKQIFSL